MQGNVLSQENIVGNWVITLLTVLFFLQFVIDVKGQSIANGTVTGVISTCIDSPSENPYLQQFNVSGNDLSSPINISAPTNFEVSLSKSVGYGNSITLTPVSGDVSTTVVYVRASANSIPGAISGAVVISSSGAATSNIAVSGVVHPPSTINPIPNQSLNTQESTNEIIFSSPNGTAIYNWTNNSPAIGLAANGTGNIPSFTAINTGEEPVVATITATPVPTGFAYVPNSSGQVSVINTISMEEIAVIPVGSNPYGVSINQDGSKVYITNNGVNNVSVIDTRINEVVATIEVGSSPTGLAVNPVGDKLYVANFGSNTISVINTLENSVSETISVGIQPLGITVSPDGSRVYVSGADELLVFETSTNSQIATIPVGSLPAGLAISPDGNRLYVANNGIFDNTVSVINTETNTLITSIPVGNNPYGVVMSPDGSLVYVSNLNSNTISVINTSTNTVNNSIAVNAFPQGISISSDGSRLFAVSKGAGSLEEINTSTNTSIASVNVGSLPISFGNFVTSNSECIGMPLEFTITVNPIGLLPTLDASIVSGSIFACSGTPSTNSNLQKLSVTANNLSSPVTVTASPGFEVSTIEGGDYLSTLILTPDDGSITDQIIYIRSTAAAEIGINNGNIVLSSDGVAPVDVSVEAVINELPTLEPISDRVFSNEHITQPIDFPGTFSEVTWTNSNPAIGLASSGTGQIPSFQTINAGDEPVVATIAVTPNAKQFGYISSNDGRDVSVIDLENYEIISRIPVGSSNQYGISVSPDGSRVYLANFINLLTINTRTNSVIARIPVPGSWAVTVSPDGSRIYAVGSQNKITVIDAEKNIITGSLNLGENATYKGIVAHPDGSRLYVVSYTRKKVIVVNTNTNQIIKKISLGYFPENAIISPDGSKLYVSHQAEDWISVIGTENNEVIENIDVGGSTRDFAIDGDRNRLYVARGDNNIYVINTQSFEIEKKIPSPSPEGISLSADKKRLYVTNGIEGTMSVIDTETDSFLTNVAVGGNLTSIGDFVTPGTNCSGFSKTFTITINPALLKATEATGTITSCAGTVSSDPDLQQFNVVGKKLISPLTVSTPANFEISNAPNGTFENTLTIVPVDGDITATVYARSSETAPVGSIYGTIDLTATNITPQYVKVQANINPVPKIDPIDDQIIIGGADTTPITFSGSGGTREYAWTNDNPSIGLSLNGRGNISSFRPINESNLPVEATISVKPISAGLVYLASITSDHLIVYNSRNNAFVSYTTVGNAPYGVAVSPKGDYVYVSNSQSSNVSVYNTNTNNVDITIDVGTSPQGIVVSPDGNRVFVCNRESENISVIDANTQTVISTIDVQNYPQSIAVSPDGNRLYVGGNTILVMDAYSYEKLSEISLNGWGGIAVSPDGSRVYVADGFQDMVVIDAKTNTVVASVEVGIGPRGLVVSPDGKLIYVAVRDASIVAVIDAVTNKVIHTIPVEEGSPHGISLTANGEKIFLSANSTYGPAFSINTTDYAIKKFGATGMTSFSFGNFVTRGGGCIGQPTDFKLIVNPNPLITTNDVTGSITACAGAYSESPSVQQFTVMGTNLVEAITVTSPTNFEISISEGEGYSNSIVLTHNDGIVESKTIYIRSTAQAPAGNIIGDVVLTSQGAQEGEVEVRGTIHSIPTLGSTTLPVGSINTPYSFQVTGVPDGYLFSANGLPEGLTIDPTSGIISGTPTEVTPSEVTIELSVTGHCSQSTTYTLTIEKEIATISLSDMIQVYDGTEKSVSVLTSPSNLPVTVTYDGSTTPPVYAGTYEVVATVNTAQAEGSATGTITIKKAPVTNLIFANTQGTYDGEPKPVEVTTEPSGLPIHLTYDGLDIAPINSGTYSVVATVQSDNYEGSASTTLIIEKALASGLIANNARVYDGQSIPVMVTTTPPGLPMTLTYDDSPSPPINAGTYDIVVTVNDENYSGIFTETLTIQKATLSITANDQSRIYGDQNPDFTLIYSGFVNGETSNDIDELPVVGTTASSDSDAGVYPITISGGFSQNYNLMLKNGELTVSKAPQSIQFTDIGDRFTDESPITLSATADSGLPVSFIVNSGNATVTGNTLTFFGGGEVTVSALQEGNKNYLPAQEVQQFTTLLVLRTEYSSAHNVILFPNPATDRFAISLPDHWITVDVTIYDMKGNKVLETQARRETLIKISHLSKGNYKVYIKHSDIKLANNLIIR